MQNHATPNFHCKHSDIISCSHTFFTPLPKVQTVSSDCSRTLSDTNVTCDEEALMTCTKIQLNARQRCDIRLCVLIGTKLTA